MAVSVHDVRKALEELGELRFGEMNIQDGMREIVRTTHAVFDVDGAGLMLTGSDQHLRNVSVSDDVLGHLERIQVEHHEGPCVEAFETCKLVCSEDLGDEDRWPLFTADATKAGVHAVMASPIPYKQNPAGVVVVVSKDSHPWSPEGELALMAFTDLAALLIASMMSAEKHEALAGQLQHALDSRTVVEQAKGILMATEGKDARAAYEQLRALARSSRRTLASVSSDVVRDRTRRPDEVVSAG